MDNTILKNKTKIVILVTLITMVAEIFFGLITNSMALTADGFHMGTHVLALSITFIMCIIINKYKEKEELLNAVGGYTSALLLLITSFFVIYESTERLLNTKEISFNDALLVTVIGLIVNVICMLIMEDNHHHNHNHKNHENKEHNHGEKNENLNFKAAYLHILTDVLTSVIAIIALLMGKYFNLVFLDPIMGIVGGLLILKWSINLIRKSFDVFVK